MSRKPVVGPPVPVGTPPSGDVVRVTAVAIKPHVIIFGPNGLIKGQGTTNEVMIPEAEFFPGLIDFLRAKGLIPPAGGSDDPIPTKVPSVG